MYESALDRCNKEYENDTDDIIMMVDGLTIGDVNVSSCKTPSSPQMRTGQGRTQYFRDQEVSLFEKAIKSSCVRILIFTIQCVKMQMVHCIVCTLAIGKLTVQRDQIPTPGQVRFER